MPTWRGLRKLAFRRGFAKIVEPAFSVIESASPLGRQRCTRPSSSGCLPAT